MVSRRAAAQVQSADGGLTEVPAPILRKPSATGAALALALAAVCLAVAIRGADLRATWDAMRRVHPIPLAWAALLFSTACFARSLRWRALLAAQQRLGALQVFWATMAGYVGNNFLPLRAGEVIRSLLIGRRTGMSSTYVLATALIERIADTLLLLALLPLVLSRVAALPAGFTQKLYLLGGILLAMLAGSWWLIRTRERLNALIAWLPLPARICHWAQGCLSNFSEGLASVLNARRAAAVVFWSMAAWALDCLGAGLIASSFGLALPPVEAFALLSMLGLSSALPSTPGYLGIYQFVAVLVLCPFGFSRSQALAYIIVFQAVSYVQVSIWGFTGLFICRKTFSLPGTVVPGVRRDPAVHVGATAVRYNHYDQR